MAWVDIRDVHKVYERDTQKVTVLDGLSLQIEEGEFVALMGPSGSGKTTLLNLIGGIDQPTSGDLIVAGTNIAQLKGAQLAKWRSATIGYIFQLYNLMPVLTAQQNVELPLMLYKMSGAERKKRASFALDLVGLSDRMTHYPRQLSGGQEQRVAIARALVSDPKLLLADEPTGDLDRKSGEEILQLLERLNREFKKTIIMVTHDPHAAERAHRLVHLDKGVLTA
jgi:putative ABC transport system ATP-binding protein